MPLCYTHFIEPYNSSDTSIKLSFKTHSSRSLFFFFLSVYLLWRKRLSGQSFFFFFCQLKVRLLFFSLPFYFYAVNVCTQCHKIILAVPSLFTQMPPRLSYRLVQCLKFYLCCFSCT